MHIHAKPVACAVHVKLEIASVGNDILCIAHLVGIEQAHIEHALRQHFDGGFMRVDKAGAFVRGCNGGVLGRQHQFIKLTLRGTEFAIGRKGSRDVAGIAIEFTARIDQHQIAIQNGRGIGTVVQHTGVGTARHDGTISRILRAVQPKFVQQFGVEVIFTNIFARAQH